jgi:preprotein translocase subunit YajC
MEGIASIVPLILVFLIMYFLLIRPQQRKLKEHQAMVAALRRGDQIVTSGGIVGRVTRVKEGENEVDVEIAPTSTSASSAAPSRPFSRRPSRRKPDMILIPLWQRLLVALPSWRACSAPCPNLFYDAVERHNDAVARSRPA